MLCLHFIDQGPPLLRDAPLLSPGPLCAWNTRDAGVSSCPDGGALSPQPAQTVLIDDCQQQCLCYPGKGLVCQNHSCDPKEVCQSSAGILSCARGAGLGLGPVWLGTEDSNRAWCDLNLYGGRHRGLRIEVSDMGTPGLGFPGPGAETLQPCCLKGRDPHGGTQSVGALRAGCPEQMSGTLIVRQEQTNFFSRGPEDKYLNLQAI